MVGFLSLITGVRQCPAGFVAYPSSSNRRNSSSGAPTSFQLRNSLADVAEH